MNNIERGSFITHRYEKDSSIYYVVNIITYLENGEIVIEVEESPKILNGEVIGTRKTLTILPADYKSSTSQPRIKEHMYSIGTTEQDKDCSYLKGEEKNELSVFDIIIDKRKNYQGHHAGYIIMEVLENTEKGKYRVRCVRLTPVGYQKAIMDTHLPQEMGIDLSEFVVAKWDERRKGHLKPLEFND